MPPRKSDQRKSDVSAPRPSLKEDGPETAPIADTITAAQSDAHDASSAPEKKDSRDKDATTIEDLILPKSIITRLAKGVLPPNTQIQANAILAMSKSTTVFVNYLASSANQHTTNAGKKTVSPDDVFKALEDVEFGFFRERLEAEFNKFNAIQTEKRNSYRNKTKAAAKPDTSIATDADTSMADATTISVADTDTPAPRAKKARVEGAPKEDYEHDDAETEDEETQEVDDDDDDDEVEEEEEEEEEEEAQRSGDETQDALEEDARVPQEKDEALDGDESD